MNRIDTRFATLKQEERAGLITFAMACDPDFETSLAIVNALPKAGADIIEVGMPFSDPMADGAIIQEAGLRALAAGGSSTNTLKLVESFRKGDTNTPIILMGYYNPIYHYGIEKFCNDAAKAGVDGLIIVDVPPEEEAEIRRVANTAGIYIIRLTTPTSDTKRLPLLLKEAEGFVYYISVAGITGTKSAAVDALKERVKELRPHTKLPIAIGFGIKTAQQVTEIANIADAAVVGSALVKVIAEAPKSKAAQAAHDFVASLAEALKH